LSTSALKGSQAEDFALAYLQQQGLVLIARNFACRLGELDLVMQHQKTLVFVEVKYRQHHGFGGSIAALTRAKQQRLVATAQLFLKSHSKWQRYPCRFDLVALQGPWPVPEVNWLQDAFQS
jgi:putative endonuclease